MPSTLHPRLATASVVASVVALLLAGCTGSGARQQGADDAGPQVPGTGEVIDEVDRLPPATAPLVIVGGSPGMDEDVARMLAACDPQAETIGGADATATAALLADRAWGGGPVLLASVSDFPDALGAGPIAARQGGAILLTDPAALSPPTADWLRANAVDDVVVMGGTAAIAEEVADQVRALGPSVRRVAGPDRFATAAAAAGELDTVSTVLIASGRSFPDALALGPVAAAVDGAVLLVERDSLPIVTADAIRAADPEQIIVAGGPAVVAEAIVEQIREFSGVGVRRIGGENREQTAALLAAEIATGTGTVVADGRGFAAALAAGPLAARLEGPLLLVGEDITGQTGEVLTERRDWSCRPVAVAPSATEGLTLGPSSQPTSVGGVVALTASVATAVGHASVPIRHPAGAGMLLDGAATVTMAYPVPAGGVPAVTWTEEITAADRTVVAEQPWRHQTPAPRQGLTVAWQYTGNSERYRREVAAAPGLNVTAPFRYFFDTDGSFRGAADPSFIADMHTRGVQVWPTIHTAGAAAIEAALSDPQRRLNYAHAISRDAEAAGADGINIDIEGFRVDMREEVTEFSRLLTDDVHRWGGVTSFDFTSMTDTWITPPEGYEFWSTAPDRRALGEIVDYSVLMAYDQFNRFRPRGPVASDPWVDEALRYQLRFTDPERILLGLPFYARIWADDRPSAVGQATLKSLIAGQPRTPEPDFGVDRVVTRDGRVTWAETADRLSTRLDMVERYGLAGTASWRLGFDDAATWETVGR